MNRETSGQSEGIQEERTQRESGKRKVLIIEDELALSRVLQLKLAERNLDIEVVHDGGEAEDVIRQKKYDTILLDLILPTKNGFDLLPIIREVSPQTKVIVMTNLGQPEDRERVQEFNPEGYFVKSEIAIFDLVTQIQTIVES
jgi:two-component system copper resistance phosphate regulon response regulator CusR